MMNVNEIVLHPPAQVVLNQWKDGSIHFRCPPQAYALLADLFERLTAQCRAYAEVAATVAAQPLPPANAGRIAELEAELARLQGRGIPVSVNTNPVLSPAQQLAAAVATKAPQTVAAPGPTVMEVAAALATRGIQHPVAAAMQVPVVSPPIPPADVPPMVMPPVPFKPLNMANVNPGPAAAASPGTPAPDAPNTIVTGGFDRGGEW